MREQFLCDFISYLPWLSIAQATFTTPCDSVFQLSHVCVLFPQQDCKACWRESHVLLFFFFFIVLAQFQAQFNVLLITNTRLIDTLGKINE